MRLFIAIRFEGEALDALEATRDALFAHAKSGTPVPRDNLHLTLLFLGNIDEEDVDAVLDALDEVEDPLQMDLVVDRLEAIAGPTHGSEGTSPEECTWRAHVAENPALSRLQAHIETRMRKLGVELDQRDFQPHVTLGRHVVIQRDADTGHVAGAALPEPIRIKVDSFSLMETRPQKKHVPPRYEEICTWAD